MGFLMNSTTFVSLNSWYPKVVISSVLQMIDVSELNHLSCSFCHETKKKSELEMMFWYYYFFFWGWSWYLSKTVRKTINSCETFQNWLCSYQTSMEPTTAISRPFSPLPQQLIWQEELSQHLGQQPEYIHQFLNAFSWIYDILLADNCFHLYRIWTYI